MFWPSSLLLGCVSCLSALAFNWGGDTPGVGILPFLNSNCVGVGDRLERDDLVCGDLLERAGFPFSGSNSLDDGDRLDIVDFDGVHRLARFGSIDPESGEYVSLPLSLARLQGDDGGISGSISFGWLLWFLD